MSPTKAVFTSRTTNFSDTQLRKTQELKVHVSLYVYIFGSNSDSKLRHDGQNKLDMYNPLNMKGLHIHRT